MCLFVYLVTDANLPEIPWSKAQPAFYVERLKGKKKFLNNVPGANAYVLGSHEGCGCGFISDDAIESEEEVASKTSRERLRHYLEAAVNEGAGVAILAAWAGDEEKPYVRAKVTSSDLVEYPWAETWDSPHLIEVTHSPRGPLSAVE